MSFWQKLKLMFSRERKQKEWASRFNQPPAKPDNLTPLDPGNDPWRT